MTGIRTPVFLLATVSAVVGCENGLEESFTRTSIEDTTVLYSAEPQWPDSARLVLESRIGLLEGPEEYMFSSIRAFTVDRRGNVFVADGGTSTVRKFDARGEHVMTFGGEGSGPGELRFAQGMGILPDGRIVVRDSRLLRINVYDSTGHSVDHWPFLGHGVFGPGAGISVDSLGNVYTQVSTSSADATRPSVAIVRWTPAGQAIDTLPRPDRYDIQCPYQMLEGGMPVPQTPGPVSAFSARGYLMGCNDTYEFDHIAFDGTVRRLTRDWSPVPISDAERDFWTKGLTADFQSRQPDWHWSGTAVPDRKPAYRSFVGGDEGRIWVKVARPSASAPRPERMPDFYPETFYGEAIGYDVFAANGQYLGPVNVPMGFRDQPDPVFRADTVWAVTVDDSGVSYLGRFALVGAPEDTEN
jgi:hypothetical protein